MGGCSGSLRPPEGVSVTHRVQFLVEPTSVADVAAVGVLPPQRRLGGQAVGAEDPAAPAPLRVKDRQAVSISQEDDGKHRAA